MICILANYEHKRLHHRLAVIGSVDFQFALCALMAGDAVQQHHFIQLFITKVIKINVRAGHGIGRAGIAVLNCFG